MKIIPALIPAIVLSMALGFGPQIASAAPANKAHAAQKSPKLWVMAYYPVWHQEDNSLTPAEIDYTAFSHLIHFSIVPRADGSIDSTPNVTITPSQSAAIIGPAHAAGKKVLISVGGAETAALFRPVLTDAVRPIFIANLVNFVMSRGYDGIDVDMEQLQDSDVPLYEPFIRDLRAALNTAKPGLLLTASVIAEPAMFARLQNQFDRIDLMTYDLSGPWEGFKTWYNGNLYDAGTEMMDPGRPYPSVQEMVQQFEAAGVAPNKLSLGIAFYGDLWTGTDGPKQSIQGVTDSQIAYSAIMDQYYQPSLYHWDAQAEAPYLSLPAADPKARKFISYDDAKLCALKVHYAQQHGLGGVIIWELGDGYRANQPPGQRDPLLQAVKHAWLAPKTTQEAGR
jgi:chitinase